MDGYVSMQWTNPLQTDCQSAALFKDYANGRRNEMTACTPVLRDVLVVLLCVLTAVMLACLIRAVKGPRYTDRLVALNMICTVVVLMVCILSYVLGESYLVDVAILYGLLNLLAVAVLSRISVRRHREHRRGKKT